MAFSFALQLQAAPCGLSVVGTSRPRTEAKPQNAGKHTCKRKAEAPAGKRPWQLAGSGGRLKTTNGKAVGRCVSRVKQWNAENQPRGADREMDVQSAAREGKS